MDSNEFKNFAFISYSHRDMKIARWLQRHLESYKLPTEIHNDIEAGSRYLRPIFRDQSDPNTGILSDELRKNLEESKYLILICSVSSAQSQWVSDEAKAFVDMGRLDKIIPVIIPDGETAERELFPIYLREYFTLHPDKELLGVNIGEVGKNKSLVRIVSRMLEVSFDTLWKRYLRQKRIRIISITTLSILVLALSYIFAIPVNVLVSVTPETSHLPTGESVSVNIDGSDYTVPINNPLTDDVSLPGYKRFQSIKIIVASQFFNNIDTIISPGLGIKRILHIPLNRDKTFSIFSGTIFDSKMMPLEDVDVNVAEIICHTDSQGQFTIELPLHSQRQEQTITLKKDGYSTIIREDETPGTDLKFIMHTDDKRRK